MTDRTAFYTEECTPRGELQIGTFASYLVSCDDLKISIAVHTPSHVEAGKNGSSLALQVVRGDKKGIKSQMTQ
jgi:hypothetical protein